MADIATLYNTLSGSLMRIHEYESRLSQNKSEMAAKESAARNSAAEKTEKAKEGLLVLLREVESFINLAKRSIKGTPSVNEPDIEPTKEIIDRLNTMNIQGDYRGIYTLASRCCNYLNHRIQAVGIDSERTLQKDLYDIKQKYTISSVPLQEKIDAEYAALINGSKLKLLAQTVRQRIGSYSFTSEQIIDLPVPSDSPDSFVLGTLKLPFSVAAKYSPDMKKLFGEFYDEYAGELCIPLDFAEPTCIPIYFDSDNQAVHDHVRLVVKKWLQGILLHYAPTENRVFYMDPSTCNSDVLGPTLKSVTGDNGFLFYTDSDGKTRKGLNKLITLAGSSEDTQQRFLVLYDYPSQYDYADRELIERICNNYRQYRVTVIAVYSGNGIHVQRLFPQSFSLEFSDEKIFYVDTKGKKCEVCVFSNAVHFKKSMLTRFVDAYTKTAKSRSLMDNCPLPDISRPYPRRLRGKERETILLPIGFFENTENVAELTVNRQNSFGIITGNMGSGKSRLLHSIVENIVRQYHPDDVELWLADLKHEFTNYTGVNRPPHVRYMVLDDTPAYCSSFIRAIKSEVERRTKTFKRNGWKELRDVPDSVVMPQILIIIDEFSVMSGLLQEDDHAREILKHCVLLGSSYGIRILFCAQEMAHMKVLSELYDVIPLRVALQGTKLSMKDTLAVTIPDSISERMDHFPQRTALFRHLYTGVEVAKVFDVPDEAIRKTQEFIRGINKTMRSVQSDVTGTQTEYQNKHPVEISGITSGRFAEAEPEIRSFVASNRQADGSRLLSLFFGRPCSLENIYPLTFIQEEWQSLLLLSDRKKPQQVEGTGMVCSSIQKSAEICGYSCEFWNMGSGKLPGTAEYFDGIKNISCRFAQLKDELSQAIDTDRQFNRIVIIQSFSRLVSDFKQRKAFGVRSRQVPPEPVLGWTVEKARALKLQLDAGNLTRDEYNAIKQTLLDAQARAASEPQIPDLDLEAELPLLLQYGGKKSLYFVVITDNPAPFTRFQQNSMGILAFRMSENNASSLRKSTLYSKLDDNLMIFYDGSGYSYYTPYVF